MLQRLVRFVLRFAPRATVAVPASIALIAWLWHVKQLRVSRTQTISEENAEPTAKVEAVPQNPKEKARDAIEVQKKQRQERAAAKLADQEKSAETKLAELEIALRAAMMADDDEEALLVCAIDIEAWERDSSVITEIGLAFFTAGPKGAAQFRHRHILVSENLGRRNGRYVADNRDNFLFGDSETLTLSAAVSEVSQELKAADFLVGHALSGDLAWLRSIGVDGVGDGGGPTRKKRRDARASFEARLVDTQTLAVASAKRAEAAHLAAQHRAKARAAAASKAHGAGSVEAAALELEYRRLVEAGSGFKPAAKRSLGALAEAFNLDPTALHTAGNDAAFTLQVMLSQCSVAFAPPPRTPSRHTANDPAFQAAQAAADAALGLALGVSDQTTTNFSVEALTAEVLSFARTLERLSADASADASTEASSTEASPQRLSAETSRKVSTRGSTEAPVATLTEGTSSARASDPAGAPMEKSFPPALDAAQRRAVHEAAFAAGLSSCSRGSGSGRFVAIRAKGAVWPDGEVYSPPSSGRGGRGGRGGSGGSRKHGNQRPEKRAVSEFVKGVRSTEEFPTPALVLVSSFH